MPILLDDSLTEAAREHLLAMVNEDRLQKKKKNSVIWNSLVQISTEYNESTDIPHFYDMIKHIPYFNTYLTLILLLINDQFPVSSDHILENATGVAQSWTLGKHQWGHVNKEQEYERIAAH